MKKLVFLTIFAFAMACNVSGASETNAKFEGFNAASGISSSIYEPKKGSMGFGNGAAGIGSGEVGHQLACFILTFFDKHC